MGFGGLLVERVNQLAGAEGLEDLGEDRGAATLVAAAQRREACSAAAAPVRLTEGSSAHRRAWKRSGARSKR